MGLVLLLNPLLTMLHELGGHGGACLLTGGALKKISKKYLFSHVCGRKCDNARSDSFPEDNQPRANVGLKFAG